MRITGFRHPAVFLILILALAFAGGPLLAGCAATQDTSANPPSVTPMATAPGASTAPAPGASTAPTSAPSSAAGAASPTSPATAGGRTSQIPANTPSGPLRLYCTPRASLNPLADATASFQSISRLVYEGLFHIDGQGMAQPVLAEPGSMAPSSDGLSVTLRLAEGRLFHTGAAVTAADVAASFASLRAAGAASAYAGRLPDVAAITAADARTLVIALTRVQPDIAWQLTFPILPAASLAAGSASPLLIHPGTGPYRIAAYAAGKGLTLQASDRSEAGRRALVRTINVKELASLHDALRAFERDEIDLAGLPSDTYPAYALRNGLKLERYATDQYVFLSFRTQEGALLANPARLAFVQAASRTPAVFADIEMLGVQPAAVPVHPDSPLWKGASLTGTEYLDLYQPGRSEAAGAGLKYPATRPPLVILAPQGDTLRITLANRLHGVLAARGAAAEIRVLPPDAYQAARIAGQYDILVAQAVTAGTADPRWLMGQSPDPAIAGSELLPRTGSGTYAAASSAVDRLFAAGTTAAAGQAGLLAALGEAARLAPYIGIGFRYAALACGSRVFGQPRPQANALYEGIEELWLWST